MTETSVERIVRNKVSTVICSLFLVVLLAIMVKDFYYIFHNTEATFWKKMLPGIQLMGAFIALLWLSLLMLVSSMTMSGPAFKKSCPYTVTFLIVMGLELIPWLWNSTLGGWKKTGLIVVAVVGVVTLLLQMLAFSLDPHSSSFFAKLRPFRIEVLTVIQLSANAPSIKRSKKNSIV